MGWSRRPLHLARSLSLSLSLSLFVSYCIISSRKVDLGCQLALLPLMSVSAAAWMGTPRKKSAFSISTLKAIRQRDLCNLTSLHVHIEKRSGRATSDFFSCTLGVQCYLCSKRRVSFLLSRNSIVLLPSHIPNSQPVVRMKSGV